ncbi:VOC family protein [Streptomyces sp. NBC_01304]|uniref:VOC family protein n=1 Tax=Streptomyces sp. NBC_01304 TaxID=2903818 RepID=UPI002E11F941|nr:VOC family protein [Streptomyces sp. NBC_01304]
MAAHPQGAPCWADAMFPDIEAAKSFYGELLGWTFGESSPEYGGYTQASVDGKLVAALSPVPPGMEASLAWNLYFASSDIAATAAKIREHGGTLMMEPMEVAPFGTMVTAQDPSGVYFSVWQPDTHQGFEAQNVPGAFCWAEVTTRDAAKADAFFPAVFGYDVKRIDDASLDFHLWSLKSGGDPVIGRLQMTDVFPEHVPSYMNVYFTVADCDDAVATVQKLGGKVHMEPMDTPFGRFAAVGDPQGAAFSVIDVTRMAGEMPKVV